MGMQMCVRPTTTKGYAPQDLFSHMYSLSTKVSIYEQTLSLDCLVFWILSIYNTSIRTLRLSLE